MTFTTDELNTISRALQLAIYLEMGAKEEYYKDQVYNLERDECDEKIQAFKELRYKILENKT